VTRTTTTRLIAETLSNLNSRTRLDLKENMELERILGLYFFLFEEINSFKRQLKKAESILSPLC
jgi:hypothetical protein